MKIKKERLRNFCQFSDFEIEFDGEITNLVGINASGKTTVGLTAIWSCLKGISERNTSGQLQGERHRFIGKAGASSDIEITLIDPEKNNAEIVVKNHITANTNQITFTAPEGYVTDPGWLNNLLNISFLSAKNFAALSPKDQALALGIDVSSFDEKIKEKKEDRKLENRYLEPYKDLAEVEKVDKVSLDAMVTRKTTLDERRRADNKIFDTREYYIRLHAKLQKEYLAATADTDGVNEIMLGDGAETILIIPKFHHVLIDTFESLISHLPELDKTLAADLEAYSQDVKNVDETNAKADKYAAYLKDLTAKATIVKAIAKLEKEIGQLVADRLAHIKKINMGFEGLTIDEEGGLVFDDGHGPRPIREPYYSKGQMEIIVARLYAATKPTLKVRFIDEFDCLDEINQEKIVKFLIDEGFQVITSSVGTVAKNENTIILRECKIKQYSETEEKLL